MHEKLCNYWLIISLFQLQYNLKLSLLSKLSQGIAVTSLHCLLSLTSKNKDLKQILKSAANLVQH